MIINLRGTSGAGKSTVVRRVMGLYDRHPYYIDGRRQPLGYACHPKEGASPDVRSLWVPGHYETPCGGCDTIKTVDQVYEIVRGAAERGYDVLYEGIMVQDDVKRCVALNRERAVIVVRLTTPMSDCLAAIQARRDERGDDRELNPTNTISRDHRLRTSMLPRLREGGVNVVELDREGAYQFVVVKLGWPTGTVAEATL